MLSLHIGQQIARFRKDKHMTQEQLGEAVGVTNRTVSKWEAGVSLSGVDLIPSIASALGITLDSLFGIENMREPAERSDSITEAVTVAINQALPRALEDALENYLMERDAISIGNEGYYLSVLSRNKATMCRFFGQGMVYGPFSSNRTSNGSNASLQGPDKWFISVKNAEGWTHLGDYFSKEEAAADLERLFLAYSRKEAEIIL